MIALATMFLLAAACAADEVDGLDVASGAIDADQPADDEGAGDEEAVEEDAHLRLSSSELGDILVDGEGLTLYLFTEDADGQSVCEDDCAAAWPPLVVNEPPVAGEGLDTSLLDTLVRSDGSTQVSYGGWPLYTWAQDQQPGDITGQGVQGVWFVVSGEGEPITDGEDPSPARDDDY